MSIVNKENQSILKSWEFRRTNCIKNGQFGQSLLNLSPGVVDNENNRLIIDCNIENIPHTRKQDFIETWINVHDINENLERDKSSNQGSPIIESSVSCFI